MPSAKLTSKGQITIPRAIREHLTCDAGDRLDFQVEVDGSVKIARRTRDLRELCGLLHRAGEKAVSVEEMNEGIRRRMVAKFGRGGSG